MGEGGGGSRTRPLDEAKRIRPRIRKNFRGVIRERLRRDETDTKGRLKTIGQDEHKTILDESNLRRGHPPKQPTLPAWLGGRDLFASMFGLRLVCSLMDFDSLPVSASDISLFPTSLFQEWILHMFVIVLVMELVLISVSSKLLLFT